MSNQTFIEDLFREVVELSPEERTRELDRRCPDAEDRRQVEELLAWDARVPESFLDGEDDEPEVVSGSRIGPYHVIERLGEGGMGTVYAARQSFPHREVALKVLRSGRVSEDALRRFRHEIDVLGRLQHTGIARIYDAGTTESRDAHGLVREVPYFTMEIVRGVPIVRHAREAGLSTKERVELLAHVCDAVHYAHQRGVIHRDLKPENVLVTTEESTVTNLDDARTSRRIGQPKVLDFGIARVVEADGQDSTRHTLDGALIGSLASMSPEQVSGDASLVDVRSDVYALGAMLYELVAGRAPIALDGLTVPQAIRRIADDEPVSLDEIAPDLRGDLSVIAAKAVEKDPERRYQSAHELAADLRHHLRGEPIEARGDSRLYVLRRSLRRHRVAMGFATTVLVLVSGLAFLGFERARRSTEFAAEESRLKEQANADFASALEAIDLLTEVGTEQLVGVPRAEAARRELLGAALEFRRSLLDGRPTTHELRYRQARERAAVGRIESELGNLDRSLEELTLAVDEFEGLLAEDPEGFPELESDLSSTRAQLGVLMLTLGQLDEAGDAFQTALQAIEARLARAASEERAPTLEDAVLFGSVNKHLGRWLRELGRGNEASELMLSSLPKLRELAADPRIEDREQLESNLVAHLQQFAVYSIESGNLAGLEPFLREARALAQSLVERESTVLQQQTLLGIDIDTGVFLSKTNRTEEAAELVTGAIARGEELVRDYPLLERPREILGDAYVNLGMVHHFHDDLEAAEKALGRGAELWSGLVASHPSPNRIGKQALAENNQGGILMVLQRYDESRDALERAVVHVREALASLPDRADLHQLHEMALINLGQTAAHQADHRAAVAAVETVTGRNDWPDIQRMLFIFQTSALAAEADDALEPEERDVAMEEYLERATVYLEEAIDAGFDEFARVLDEAENWDVLLYYPPFEELLMHPGG